MSIYGQEHILFKNSVRKHAEKKLLPFINLWEEKHDFPSEVFTKLGSQGFLGILIDEKWGGVGGDYTLAAAWCEEFGRIPSVGLTTAVNMHSLVITPTVERLGSEEIKKKWLKDAVLGKTIGAYAFTEPGAGSDLTNITTKATKDGDDFIINGAKTFITNGARADFVLVLTKTDPKENFKGYTTFIVDTKLKGFSVGRKLDKLGWHASDTAELVFEDVRVPKSAVLGEIGEGWYQAMSSLNWERLMLTLGAIGGAESCISDTISYINERCVFGKKVSQFELNRERLAELWSRLEAGKALAHKCVRLLNAKKDCRKEISLAKLSICELATKIADYCLQLHGGYGYTTEFSPERWLRDLRLNTIGGGTSEIMARIAEKEVF